MISMKPINLLVIALMLSSSSSAMTFNHQNIDGQWFTCHGVKLVDGEDQQTFNNGLCRTSGQTIEVKTTEDFDQGSRFTITNLYNLDFKSPRDKSELNCAFQLIESKTSEAQYLFYPFGLLYDNERSRCGFNFKDR